MGQLFNRPMRLLELAEFCSCADLEAIVDGDSMIAFIYDTVTSGFMGIITLC